ncbi:MAG: hypothetical protein FJ109_22065, partial [Deltaproteobacteria bacterium]|nr:hypothetical protein [Deltaproteobacteria bacterium]
MRGDLTNRVQGLSKLMDQVSDDELRTLDPDFKSRENYATTWQVNLKNLRMMAQQGADKELVGQYQQLRNQWAIDHGRLSEYLKTRKGAAQFFMVDEVADRSGTYPAQMAVDRVWEREAPGQGARMAHYIRTRKMEGAAVQKAIQGLETKFPSTGGGTDLFRMSESDAIRYGKEAVSRYFKPGSDKPASLAAVVADMLAEKNEKEERTLFTGKEAGTYFNVVYQHASRYMEGVQQRLTPALLKSTYNALRTTKASMDGIVGQQKTPSSVFGAMVMDLTEDLLEDPRLKTNIPARVDAFFKDKLNDEQYSMYENVVGRMQSGGGRLPSNAPPEALALQDQIVMVQESVKLKLKVDAKQVADERKAINEIQARKIEAIEQVGGVGIPHPIDGRVMPLRAGKYANDLIEAMAAAKGDPEKQAELWTAASRSLAGNQQQLTQTLSEYQYLHQKRSAMIMEAQATGKTEEQIRAQLSGTANQSESEGSTTLAILEHLRGTGAFQIPFGSPTEEQLRNNEATYFDPFFT